MKALKALEALTRTVDSLRRDEQHEMYNLMCCYYDACNHEQFITDLSEKHYVIQFRDCDGVLQGFSTLAVLDFTFQRKQQRALYSGDTIIHHDFWGTQELPLAWCRLAGSIKMQAPSVPLYWFLIVKGHRTYRYLSLFSKHFYPTWRATTPSTEQALMNFLAANKFGTAYLADKGIIRFTQSHGHLRANWANIPDYLQNKPDVKFFLQKNPGYTKGDELVCLTELSVNNLRSFALRAFQQGMVQAPPSVGPDG